MDSFGRESVPFGLYWVLSKHVNQSIETIEAGQTIKRISLAFFSQSATVYQNSVYNVDNIM